MSSWLFLALILHWLGLSSYRDLEIDRTLQSLFIFSPSILGAATAFVLTPEFPDEGVLDLESHYFSVAPWIFPLAAAFYALSGFSDLLVPGKEPAPMVLFLGQGALLLWLGFTRRRGIHRSVLTILCSAVLIGAIIGRA
jgi:hypothetical protein